jgi:hypothetical protein
MFCYSQVSIHIGAKGKITSEGEVEVLKFRSVSLGASHIELTFTHGNHFWGRKIGFGDVWNLPSQGIHFPYLQGIYRESRGNEGRN